MAWATTGAGTERRGAFEMHDLCAPRAAEVFRKSGERVAGNRTGTRTRTRRAFTTRPCAARCRPSPRTRASRCRRCGRGWTSRASRRRTRRRRAWRSRRSRRSRRAWITSSSSRRTRNTSRRAAAATRRRTGSARGAGQKSSRAGRGAARTACLSRRTAACVRSSLILATAWILTSRNASRCSRET